MAAATNTRANRKDIQISRKARRPGRRAYNGIEKWITAVSAGEPRERQEER
jgi:hypothetical protein